MWYAPASIFSQIIKPDPIHENVTKVRSDQIEPNRWIYQWWEQGLKYKAKAKDLTFKAKDLSFKAKAKDLTFKAKAKDLSFKDKPRTWPSRPRPRTWPSRPRFDLRREVAQPNRWIYPTHVHLVARLSWKRSVVEIVAAWVDGVCRILWMAAARAEVQTICNEPGLQRSEEVASAPSYKIG